MRRLSEEGGATAVLVAILVLVLLSFAAFAVDVGALYQERRELQNGADAAALAVVQDCAEGIGSSGCAPTLTLSVETDCGIGVPLNPILAELYADSNGNDGEAKVQCVTLAPLDQSVTAMTRTEVADGTNALPHWFAPVFGIASSTVQARATAAWGTPSGLPNLFPLAISDCEFDLGLTTQGGFVEPPTAVDPLLLVFHNPNAGPRPPWAPPPSPCDSGPAGTDVPGGFGWLDNEAGTDCSPTITDGQIAHVDTGNDVPNACKAVLEDLKTAIETPGYSSEEVKLLAIFDDASGSGAGGEYELIGFAAFHFTGFFFQPSSLGAPGSRPNDYPCKSPLSCIEGYFTQFIAVDAVDLSSDPDFGVVAVQLIK